MIPFSPSDDESVFRECDLVVTVKTTLYFTVATTGLPIRKFSDDVIVCFS